jgi:hypothetical protein
MFYFMVIPVKTGIQFLRDYWMPAFAGMTHYYIGAFFITDRPLSPSSM